MRPVARAGSTTTSSRRSLDYLRYGASPGMLEALLRMNKEIDIRHVLPAVRVPTLVLHGGEDELVPLEAARYLADAIPGARFVELPGAAISPSAAAPTRIDVEIERFLTDVWESGGWDETEPDRVLATVLFTDIVGSTAKALELGDRGWRELLERHHALVRRELVRFRGREIDTAGDGFFAASTAPPARSAAPARSSTACANSASRSAPACIPANARSRTARSRVSPCIPVPASRRTPGAARSSCRAPSRISSPAPGSSSRTAAHELKGIPGEWRLFSVSADPPVPTRRA